MPNKRLTFTLTSKDVSQSHDNEAEPYFDHALDVLWLDFEELPLMSHTLTFNTFVYIYIVCG